MPLPERVGARMIGFGYAVPDRRVGNAEIEAQHGLPSGWIEQRTGIVERRYAGPGDTLSGLAIAAGRMALATAPCPPELLLLATSTPDQLLPPSAPRVAHGLGLSCGAIDLAGACSGFLYALTLADAHCRAHRARVLVIAANILSRRINPADIATQVLFADAAGAVLVAPDSDSPDSGIVAADLASDGAGYGLIGIAPGDSAMHMAGREVFQRAVELQTDACRRVMAAAAVGSGDIDRWAPHQANRRIISAVGQRLDIAQDRWVDNLAVYGNSSAATIPLALALHAANSVRSMQGTTLMSSIGAGLLSAALIWRQK